MATDYIDYHRLRAIVNKLHSAPESIRNNFPPLLEKPHYIITQASEKYLLLVFASKEENKRIEKFNKKNLNPFPGLIRLQNDLGPTAISLNSNQKFFLIGNTTTNLFSLRLGEDCSVVIQNHKININTKKIGTIQYTLDLAYLISYGKEINKHNVLEYLDDLIAFSVKTWSEQ